VWCITRKKESTRGSVLLHRKSIKARVDRVAHSPFFRTIWPHRAIIAIDNWFEWVDEGGAKTQPYLIRRTALL
jgi:putative SOS response-associated peptidase YedK